MNQRIENKFDECLAWGWKVQALCQLWSAHAPPAYDVGRVQPSARPNQLIALFFTLSVGPFETNS